MNKPTSDEPRVAILVDCDNVSPDILEHALRVAAQFGRVVMRRGYGNQASLANRWQDALTRLAFSPCLQYQYAPGKNTGDMALALDALEALFDGRVEHFCVVTSDSDFAYLCRKLRERGASVCVVGEPKTPDALRNASDQFMEWSRPLTKTEVSAPLLRESTSAVGPGALIEPAREEGEAKSTIKRSPKFVADAVAMLVRDTSEGKVAVGLLGQYLKRTNPAFSPQTYGHSGLLSMIKTYPAFAVKQEEGGHWSVGLAAK